MSDNPFSEPLGTGLPEGIVQVPTPLAVPRRLAVAGRAVGPIARLLLWIYLTWGVFLLFLAGVTFFETLTGESVSLVGEAVYQIVAWSDVLWPYNYPLAFLSFLLAASGLAGAVHGLRLQNRGLARWAGHLAYWPLLGPWLGIFAVVGWLYLRRLSRPGVAGMFDGPGQVKR
ncbi:hypothetical protein [Roseimaritima sediminicola]|uniref:hypothetical protein n=1 Tax=Roseimaritima sediminicola TaxID=2662066 RepID=UPI0012982883|nr:hypothetical protein [Roseimaritima sediminicola]